MEAASAKESALYTNGGNFAITAMGRPTIVGNITTAIGEPHDIVGLLHVVEAGGYARCYSIKEQESDRKLDSGQSFKQDHLVIDNHDITSCDLVIAANNMQNLQKLEEALRIAASYKP